MRYNGRVSWLWCCFGVLLAGCAQVTNATRTPTLTLLTLSRPAFTPTPILRLLRTPTLRATSISVLTFAAPTPLPIPPGTPNCYETPVGSLWCLGLLRNTLTVPIGQVIITVYLVRADGTALAEKQTATPRTHLAPGEFSPYGVLFDTIPDGFAGPVAVLISIGTVAPTGAVSVHDVQSELRDTTYHVTGTLANADSRLLHNLSIVVTLMDDGGRVTGFRKQRWPADHSLGPGAILPFAIDATPQGMGTTQVQVSAEAD